jgi:hypothetical protein
MKEYLVLRSVEITDDMSKSGVNKYRIINSSDSLKNAKTIYRTSSPSSWFEYLIITTSIDEPLTDEEINHLHKEPYAIVQTVDSEYYVKVCQYHELVDLITSSDKSFLGIIFNPYIDSSVSLRVKDKAKPSDLELRREEARRFLKENNVPIIE